jgi:hypothetical protein
VRLGRVCSHEFGWISPNLDPDVDVVHRRLAGRTELSTGKVVTRD